MRLNVTVFGQPAGILEQTSPAGYRFTYFPGANPLSLTMPVREAPYQLPHLPPIFQVSLPEGDLRVLLERDLTRQEREQGDMAILSQVGRHLIGAVAVAPDGAFESPQSVSLITDQEIGSLLRQRATKEGVASLIERYARQSGVSGGYLKVLVSSISADRQEDWIVKLPSATHPHVVTNEFFSMQAARFSGIETAHTRLSDDGQLLLVRRFDRTPEGALLGFEDMASLLGLPSGLKFSGSVERILKTITIFCEGPAQTPSLRQFFRQYALAMILRNGDAHLKNFGLLYPQGGPARLAPCYDMVTMAAYAPWQNNGKTLDIPALMWGGTKRWPTRDHLERLASLCREDASPVLSVIESGVHRAAASLLAYAHDHPGFREHGDTMLRLWREGLTQVGLRAEFSRDTAADERPNTATDADPR